jgi:hypothetical protein
MRSMVEGAWRMAQTSRDGEGDHSAKTEWWRGRGAGLKPPSVSPADCHLPASGEERLVTHKRVNPDNRSCRGSMFCPSFDFQNTQ